MCNEYTDPANTYISQANEFLEKYSISFSAKLLKNQTCPLWCDGEKHIHGKKYIVTLKKANGKKFRFGFYNSFNDALTNTDPTPYDVLVCIGKYIPDSFEEFCNEFGYDSDSIKAYKMWKASLSQYKKECEFFTEDELEELGYIM